MPVEEHVKALFGGEITLPTMQTEDSYDCLIAASLANIAIHANLADSYANNTMRRTSDIGACHNDASQVLQHLRSISKMCERIQSSSREQFVRAANRQLIENWVDELLRNHKDDLIANLTCYLIKH